MPDPEPEETAKTSGPESKEPDYDEFWGEDAKPVQVKVEPHCSISLPDRFLHGPLARNVARKLGNDSPDALQRFCKDALVAWYGRYRDRKARASPERRQEILALIPTPERNEPMGRIDVNATDDIKPEAFGRVLSVRFKANPHGRSMAMREAILEALLETRGG